MWIKKNANLNDTNASISDIHGRIFSTGLIPSFFVIVKCRAIFPRAIKVKLMLFLIVSRAFFQQSFHLEISSYSSDDLLNTCRICRDETVRESLISPCRCSGTLGKCHVQCLEKWLSRANKDSCEICGHVYQTMRLPRSFKEVSSTLVNTICVLTNI